MSHTDEKKDDEEEAPMPPYDQETQTLIEGRPNLFATLS